MHSTSEILFLLILVYPTYGTPVRNSIGVINTYVDFHRSIGYEPTKVAEGIEKLKKYIPNTEETFGIKSQSLEDLKQSIRGELPELIRNRHSVRQFASNAVALAMKAPSACNKQSCKVYYYQDEETNGELAELIAGNTGIKKDVKAYLMLTNDMSAFYDAYERNQM